MVDSYGGDSVFVSGFWKKSILMGAFMATYILKTIDGKVFVFAKPSIAGQKTTFVNQSNKEIAIIFEKSPFIDEESQFIVGQEPVIKEISQEAFGDFIFRVIEESSPTVKSQGVVSVSGASEGDEVTIIWSGTQIMTGLDAQSGDAVTFTTDPPGTVFVKFEAREGDRGFSPLVLNGVRLPNTIQVPGTLKTTMGFDAGTPTGFVFHSSITLRKNSEQSGGSDLGDLIAIPPV